MTPPANRCRRTNGQPRAWFASRAEATAFAANPANVAYSGDVPVQCAHSGCKNGWHLSRVDRPHAVAAARVQDNLIAELRRKFPGRVTVVSYEGLKFAVEAGIDCWEFAHTDSFQEVIRDIGTSEQKQRLEAILTANRSAR